MVHGSEVERIVNEVLDEEEVMVQAAKRARMRRWAEERVVHAESLYDTLADSDEEKEDGWVFFSEKVFLCEKGIGFVRIDGNTLARDRQSAVQAFRSSAEIKIAVIGITAGGVGVDFSSAQNVVFLELPQSASEMLQMEGVAPPQNDEQRNVVVEADDNPLPSRPGKRGRRQCSKVWGHYTIVEEIGAAAASVCVWGKQGRGANGICCLLLGCQDRALQQMALDWSLSIWRALPVFSWDC